MNEEIKRQWIADLRDGTREQGHGKLRDRDGRQCCLDVLMEQSVRAGISAEPVLDLDDGDRYVYQGYNLLGDPMDVAGVLTDEVTKWAGLEENNPYVKVPEKPGTHTLSTCNDSYYMSFDQIADLIADQL